MAASIIFVMEWHALGQVLVHSGGKAKQTQQLVLAHHIFKSLLTVYQQSSELQASCFDLALLQLLVLDNSFRWCMCCIYDSLIKTKKQLGKGYTTIRPEQT